MKRIILITGPPGIGKTTILLKTAQALKAKGYKVMGMTTQEARTEGNRTGFEIIDYSTGQKGWLAHINQPDGPQVSKYRVNLTDLNNIGAKAIHNATTNAQIIIIDEIGPMELHSTQFKDAVTEALNSQKPIIGTIHSKARDPLIQTIKTREDSEILEVNHNNRQTLHNLITDKITQTLHETSQRSPNTP